jgi:exonuclease VII large subunit
MTKISQLTELMRSKTEQQKMQLEAETERELQSYRKAYREQLKAGLNTMREDTAKLVEKQQQRLRAELSESEAEIQRAAEKLKRQRNLMSSSGWLWVIAPALTAGMIFAASWVAWGWYSQELVKVRAQVEESRKTLETLEGKGGRIQISRCGETKRLCAQVDEKAGRYGENYMILKGY